MKKKPMLAVLIAVVAPALWLGSGGGPGWADNNLGFGQKLAGGWLAEVNVGAPVEILISLSADGGVIASGQLRWAGPPCVVNEGEADECTASGTGGWESTRYNTTSHGSWKRTGRNEIEVLALLLIQDNDGNVVMYEKIRMEATLNRAATTLEGSGQVQLILAGNDPLAADAPVFVAIPMTETLRRIQ
jgi:hypothetical protein